MHHWAIRGIAARGVLLDLATDDPFDGSPIGPADLERAATEQAVDVCPGDVLLIRTRWAAAVLAAGGDGEGLHWRGLEASDQMAEFLWDHQVAIIGADNPAVENSPGEPSIGSLHRRLLPSLGMPMMELLDLERLTTRCREQRRWDFLFVAVPLHLRGGVSSTANAMAIV
jgi:kynurenine formamidase